MVLGNKSKSGIEISIKGKLAKVKVYPVLIPGVCAGYAHHAKTEIIIFMNSNISPPLK